MLYFHVVLGWRWRWRYSWRCRCITKCKEVEMRYGGDGNSDNSGVEMIGRGNL